MRFEDTVGRELGPTRVDQAPVHAGETCAYVEGPLRVLEGISWFIAAVMIAFPIAIFCIDPFDEDEDDCNSLCETG